MPSGRQLRFLGLVALAVLGGVALAWAGRAGVTIEDLREAIARCGPWGPAAYLAAAAVLPLAWVPRLGLATVAGALFGAPLGAVLASVGGLLGVALGFAVARGMGAEWVTERPGAHRIRDLLERHGFPLVVLGRVCPAIPCEAVSLACGVLALPFGRYLAASAVAIVPTSVLYAAMGASAAEQEAGLASALAVVNTAIAVVAAAALARLVATARRARAEGSTAAREDR